MSLEEKVKAQEAIETCISRYYTIQKAVTLSKRNVAAGVGVLDQKLQEIFYLAFLNLREELEGVIEDHIAQGNKVGGIISAKVINIYTKCLRSLRAYTMSEFTQGYNRLNYLSQYEQPKILAEEIADLSLVSDEFLEDINATSEEIQEEVETFS
tara:strand:- start:2752 stop:3213 length:462 start_codon:yes stop_codon:yes gene_type:complete